MSKHQYPIEYPPGFDPAPMLARWRGKPSVYAIGHVPSASMFIATCTDTMRSYLQWRSRLKHLDARPALNFAFRAVYTKRADFVFVILHLGPNKGQKALEECGAKYATALANARAKYERRFILNTDASTSSKQFWMTQCPEGEIGRRFLYERERRARARKDRIPRKVVLVPGKLQGRVDMHAVDRLPSDRRADAALAANTHAFVQQGKATGQGRYSLSELYGADTSMLRSPHERQAVVQPIPPSHDPTEHGVLSPLRDRAPSAPWKQGDPLPELLPGHEWAYDSEPDVHIIGDDGWPLQVPCPLDDYEPPE